MGKIKLTVPHTVVHGERISFKAPCSSADTTGLTINNVIYTAVDANINSIFGIDGLWVKDTMLSAVLDTKNKRAYVVSI